MDFHCSSGNINIDCSSFINEKSPHQKCIDDHHLNYAIELTLPNEECSTFDNVIRSAGDSFILVERLPLRAFIDPTFIEDLVQKGPLTSLSIGENIDIGNVVALLPSGTLLLSLTKETYQELGLQGQASRFNPPHKTTRYIVEINLKHAEFRPGKVFYERVKSSLGNHTELAFTFLVNCDKNLEPTLLRHLQPFSYQCHHLTRSSHSYQDIPVPVIDKCQQPIRSRNGLGGETFDQLERQVQATDFHEWLGAVASRCKLTGDGGPDNYTSTYACPSPNELTSSVHHERWTGFVSPATIGRTLEALRRAVSGGTARLPWGAMTVHGFIDSPVTWGTKEHGCGVAGDHLYTVVVFPDDSYWLFRAVGPKDEMS